MKTRTKAPIPTALAKGRRRFDEYRRRHRPRAPLSKDLWSLAVDLAREHGLSRTARALGLDYYSLKKRVNAAGDSGDKSEFVELLPAGIPPGPECTIELEDGAGAKMRIHLKGAELPDLADMARLLPVEWGRVYGHPVVFLETFVDPTRHRGTCYRAANWVLLGRTTGRGKDDLTHKPNRSIKDILGYPLSPRFRAVLWG